MRALLSIAILSALAASASAEEKQEVAVLGLEVSGKIDHESTSVAFNLTQELRKQVKSSAKYALAKNSEKELLDEKVAHSCDKETTDCMTTIAKKLNASLLIYGKVYKKKEGEVEGYQLDLKLLDVERKSRRPVSVWIPLEDTVGTAIIRPAARAYKDAVGPDEMVSAPVPPVVDKPKKKTNIWKPVAVVSIAATVASIAGSSVFFVKFNDLEKKGSARTAEDDANGKRWERNNRILAGASIGIGLFAVYATYKGFIAKREDETPKVSGRVRTRKNIAVTPIISPDGAGATVRFDW